LSACVVGLCGPIGAGKSQFARVACELGWETVDVDKLAHSLYAPGTGLSQAIFAAFGEGVRHPDGSVDRKALGATVFADATRMKELEALVHPAVHREMDALLERARREGTRLVLEAAILPRRPEFCRRLDAVVAVTAPQALRLERVMARDGLDRDAAQARLARAVSPEMIAACATHVLDNDLDTVAFRERCLALLEKLTVVGTPMAEFTK